MLRSGNSFWRIWLAGDDCSRRSARPDHRGTTLGRRENNGDARAVARASASWLCRAAVQVRSGLYRSGLPRDRGGPTEFQSRQLGDGGGADSHARDRRVYRCGYLPCRRCYGDVRRRRGAGAGGGPRDRRSGTSCLGGGGRALPERHLGLVQARERAAIDERLDVLADIIGAAIDLDAVRQSARPGLAVAVRDDQSDRSQLRPPGQRIALAQDRAFSFIYPHLLRQWRLPGAEIIPFSPLAAGAPDAAAHSLWGAGGYPEPPSRALASAHAFPTRLGRSARRSISIHGDCS